VPENRASHPPKFWGAAVNIHPQALVAACAGSACLMGNAVLLHEEDVDQATSTQLRAAYLECDRISAASRVDQEFMMTCERVARVLRDRDFGGDFERQLAWWRSQRGSPQAPAADASLACHGDESRLQGDQVRKAHCSRNDWK
jgi:hypothetical protein